MGKDIFTALDPGHLFINRAILSYFQLTFNKSVVQLSINIRTGFVMDIVIDTSALLAVIIAEPEREKIVKLTTGHTLIGPGSIPWEIGNAFSAMLKQHRLQLTAAQEGLGIFQSIPLRLVKIDFNNAIAIAHQVKMYAYDAYFLDCAVRCMAPLLTLDQALKRAAIRLGIKIMEA
jgi:predicted nucleic acid-binding protein